MATNNVSDLDKNLSTLQELAMFAWMINPDALFPLETVTGFKVLIDLWKRVDRTDEIDALRELTLMSIAEFVKKNPNASPATIRTEVNRQVELFASQVDILK